MKIRPSSAYFRMKDTTLDKKLLKHLKQDENAKVRRMLQRNPNYLKLIDSDGYTLLHHAAKFNNENMVKYLIRLGIDVNIQDRLGRTALMNVVLSKIDGAEKLIEILLDANSYVHLYDSNGQSGLQIIFKSELNRYIENLCVRNLMLHCTNDQILAKLIPECKHPLYSLMCLNHPMLTRLLLQHGYPVDTPVYSDGQTVLHISVGCCNLEYVKLLVEFGANVNATNEDGLTPIFYFNKIYRGNPDMLEILRILLDRRARIENSNEFLVKNILAYGGKQEIRLLLEYHFTLDAIELRRTTPLHHIALNDCENIFDEIIGMEFDVNARDDDEGRTPLHYALHNNSSVEFLLKNGADPNAGDNVDRTPLHVLFELSNYNELLGKQDECLARSVELLLEYGADVNAIDRADVAPLWYYRRRHCGSQGMLKILKLLLDRGAFTTITIDGDDNFQVEPLLSYAGISELDLLLEYINFSARDGFDQTALHILAGNDHEDILDVLNLFEGLDFDVNAVDSRGRTPLHHAVHNYSSVEFLLRNGANVNAVSKNGFTPLHVAFKLDNYYEEREIPSACDVRTIKILIEYGADIQAISSIGTSVIQEAVNKKEYFAVQPVVAHLAMLKVRGVVVKQCIEEQINGDVRLKKYFEFCTKKLFELMQTNAISKSVTLYDILMASDDKLEFYLRNADLALKLLRIGRKNVLKSNYIFEFMRRRVKNILFETQMKARATIIMSKLLKMHYPANHIILDAIVSYLNEEDLLTLLCD